MKRRSYFKGLGLGIFVTALILSLSSNRVKGEISDDEVRERAAKLGMVSEDKVLLSQAQAMADNAQAKAVDAASKNALPETVSKDDAIPDGSVSAGAVSSNGEIIRPKTSPKEDEAAVAGTKPSSGQEPSSGQQPSAEITSNPPEENNSSGTGTDPSEVIVITVNSGESSISVANKMVKAGLINDASQFDSYLVLAGYDRRLVVGSHPIPKGASASEMGEILTSAQ